MQDKRIGARAIIIHEGKLVSMYREREGVIYYTFPGGGKEKNETIEECVTREVFEEFGIDVKPIKMVYKYESQRSVEYFYLVDWISGEFGTGQGEEFQEDNKKGVYIPKFIEIAEIPNLPLMPPEIALVFYNDYKKEGKFLRKEVKYVLGEIK